MRVLLLSQYYPPEPNYLVRDLARALARSGHRLRVLTGFPNYPEGRIADSFAQRRRVDVVEDGVALRRVALYPSHDRSLARRAVNYCSFAASSAVSGWPLLRSADVVYVYHPPATAAAGALLARRLRGTPFVLHVQDLWPESVTQSGLVGGATRDLLTTAVDAYCRRLYAAAAGIVAIAPGMAETLRSRTADPATVHVCPNWTDEDVYASGPATAELDGPTVLYAGNLGDYQALDVAVRAATLVGVPGFRLTLVGGGVAEASLRKLVADLGVTNVEMLPRTAPAEVLSLARRSRAQLVSLRDLPFFRGTVPGKLQASLASGSAVVCAVAGDAADYVRESGAGWVVPPESPEALAAAFREVATAPAVEIARRRAAAAAYYRDHFSRERGVAAIERVLLAAAG